MLIIELVVVLVLVAINGLLAMSELAVVSSRRNRLQSMVDREVHGSRRAFALASDPGRFLSTVQIGITLVGILAGAFSGATIGLRLTAWLLAAGIPEFLAEPVAVAAVVGAITYLSLIIGELVPKQIALRQPERVACLVAPTMTMLARVAAPLVWLLDVSSRAILRLVGQHAARESQVTEEEIRTLVAEAESAGVLDPAERQMISGVMRLADRSARAIMTPRRDVDLVDLRDLPAEIRRRLRESEHSRLPATDGSPDDVVGVIEAKAILDAFLNDGNFDARGCLRSAPVVPESMDALDVVEVLRESRVHIALVHDEYGHFQGVVTTADILRSIVGAFRSGAEPEEPDLVRRDDGSFLVSGSMPVDELIERFGLTPPEPRSYDRAAGLVLTALGRLPRLGESVDIGDWRFEIVDLDGRRIDKLLVRRAPGTRRSAGRRA
jgi:putative hemolysin